LNKKDTGKGLATLPAPKLSLNASKCSSKTIDAGKNREASKSGEIIEWPKAIRELLEKEMVNRET
jgi:hypothetical protein